MIIDTSGQPLAGPEEPGALSVARLLIQNTIGLAQRLSIPPSTIAAALALEMETFQLWAAKNGIDLKNTFISVKRDAPPAFEQPQTKPQA